MIKLNIVTTAPFCFPRLRLYDSVTKCQHEQNFIFFFVASKNSWRGTLDSKTQTKERKWVSFELLKFILGSAAEGNNIRWSWFEQGTICYKAIFFRRKTADARLPNKKKRRTAWSRVKPQFAKIKVEQKRINVVLQNL